MNSEFLALTNHPLIISPTPDSGGNCFDSWSLLSYLQPLMQGCQGGVEVNINLNWFVMWKASQCSVNGENDLIENN